MKNFTNNFKQFTSRLSARWLIMALMMLVGTSSAWAANTVAGGYVYFDNTKTGWSDACIQFVIGHSSFSRTYTMTKITNTNLYYVNLSSSTYHDWGDATYYAVIGTGSKWGDGSWGSSNLTNATHRTAAYTTKYDMDADNKRYIITPANSSNDTAISIEYQGTSANSIQEDQSAKIYTNGSSSANGGTVKMTGYYMDSDNVVKSSSSTSTGASITFGATPTTTMTLLATAKTNYKFDGWYDAASGGTALSTSTTYTYTVPNSTKTIYARFLQQYTVTYNANSGSGAPAAETKTYGVALTLSSTVPTRTGYNFVEWNTKADGTGTGYAPGASYTSNATVTLYAKWEQSCVNVEVPNITSDSPICLGSELTLTLKDRQDGVTYNIGNQEIFTEGNNTYSFAPQGSGSLTVVASHEDACNDATNQIVIDYTVNALPSAPGLKTASSITVCPGNLTLANYVNVTDGTTVKWYSNEDCTEEATSPSITAGEIKDFYAKAVNNTTGCVSSRKTKLTITAYSAPKAFTVTASQSTICAGTVVTLNINERQEDVTYELNKTVIEETGITVDPSQTTTYTVVASLNGCENVTTESSVEITVKNKPTISLNPTSNTVCSGTTLGNIETYVAITKTEGSEVNWYASAQGGDALASSTALNATSYFAEATLDGCSSDRAEFTITDVLSAPTEVPNVTAPESICKGKSAEIVLNNKTAGYTYKVNGTAVDFTNNKYTVSPQETASYTIKAENKCGYKETTISITVNPLPNITISGNDKAVLYEDVTLTATATDGATVKWYEGGVEKGEGLTYVVTSATEPSKTVTAQAFLNGCESAVASHTVVFSAETCNNVADMTKIYLDVSENTGFITGNNAYVSVTASGNKSANCSNTDGANTGNYKPKSDTWWGTMTKVAGENYIYEITIPNNVTINKGTTKLSFWNKSISGYDDVYQVQAILGQTISAGTNCMKLSNANKTNNNSRQSDFYCGTWVTYANKPAITAPAVKTVSFETTPGDGNINFSGQIVKTGCDNSLTYGYEYKKVGAANWTQVVLGTDLDKDPGFTFSDNTIKDLDGEYVVRAFITNDNSTQYGAEITNDLSTTKDPVTEATITPTDAEGNPVADDKKYCVGTTAYIKVESNVKYTSISWKSEQGVDIVQTRLMNMYQFVVKGNDNIVVLLSNKYNVTPAESNTIEVNTFADPILPRVSLNKVSICSNDEVGATVKLTNVVKGQTYQLYQQIDNGDDTFTEQAISEAKTQTEEVTDKTELVLHTLNNTYTTGKYFVKTYTSDCEENKVATQPFTFTVVDAAEVFISIDPARAETTPWMPAKFTVNASDKYTLNVTKGNPAEPATEVEVNQNGNKVSVKIPLPQGSTLPEGTTGVYGQYENVVFPQNATTQYTITATLSAAGGDNPCAAPTSATINLVPYVEECTKGH